MCVPGPRRSENVIIKMITVYESTGSSSSSANKVIKHSVNGHYSNKLTHTHTHTITMQRFFSTSFSPFPIPISFPSFSRQLQAFCFSFFVFCLHFTQQKKYHIKLIVGCHIEIKPCFVANYKYVLNSIILSDMSTKQSEPKYLEKSDGENGFSVMKQTHSRVPCSLHGLI